MNLFAYRTCAQELRRNGNTSRITFSNKNRIVRRRCRILFGKQRRKQTKKIVFFGNTSEFYFVFDFHLCHFIWWTLRRLAQPSVWHTRSRRINPVGYKWCTNFSPLFVCAMHERTPEYHMLCSTQRTTIIYKRHKFEIKINVKLASHAIPFMLFCSFAFVRCHAWFHRKRIFGGRSFRWPTFCVSATKPKWPIDGWLQARNGIWYLSNGISSRTEWLDGESINNI